MIRRMLLGSVTILSCAGSALSATEARATSKACAAQYAQQGKALGNRSAFMRRCGGETGRGRAKRGSARKKPDDPLAPPKDATTLACNEEYENNKAAIDGGGQIRAKFIKDCKNGVEVIPGGAAPTPPPSAPPPSPAAESKPAAPAPSAPAPASSAPATDKKP